MDWIVRQAQSKRLAAHEVLVMRAFLLAVALLYFALLVTIASDARADTPASGADAAPSETQPLPTNARRWQRTYLRSCAANWPGDPPCATLAAQIHQESTWDCDARSRVGALGCAQFMPATARDYADANGIVAPADPRWAFRAQQRYMWDIYGRVDGAADDCNRISFTLGAYNGGERWLKRDRALADSSGLDIAFWSSAQAVNSGRSAANKRENNQYADRIHRIAPRYVATRWGRSAC